MLLFNIEYFQLAIETINQTKNHKNVSLYDKKNLNVENLFKFKYIFHKLLNNYKSTNNFSKNS